jgi:hypothetical protein
MTELEKQWDPKRLMGLTGSVLTMAPWVVVTTTKQESCQVKNIAQKRGGKRRMRKRKGRDGQEIGGK